MRILVIGETCIDEFIYGSCDRLCPEAPVPVFKQLHKTSNIGMAGNVVANIEALGVDNIRKATGVLLPIKTRYIDEKSNQMIMRIDEGDNVAPIDIENINFDGFDAIVVSDYDKGFLSENDLYIISLKNKLTFLDTKKPLGWFAIRYTFIKINEPEYKQARNKDGLENKLIVTLGANGCNYNGKNYPANKVTLNNVSGAGDTFLAGLVVSYLKTKDIDTALNYANEVASIVVSKKGVCTI